VLVPIGIDNSDCDLVLLLLGQHFNPTQIEVHSGGVTWRNINAPPEVHFSTVSYG